MNNFLFPIDFLLKTHCQKTAKQNNTAVQLILNEYLISLFRCEQIHEKAFSDRLFENYLEKVL
jgi:hypothetical protein